jgi:hypothetical protein
MNDAESQVSIRGKQTIVPTIRVGDVEVITTGGWLRVAAIRDEDYFEGYPIADPERLVSGFREGGGRADVFSFSQRVPDVTPRYSYPMYWDNSAVIRLGTYKEWWESLSQETRRNVRLAGKRGVTVSGVPFTDELVRGIMGIYNETPYRQGRRFWHYGKDFATVRRENGTFAGRNQFVAAHCGSELIGFIKMVFVGNIAGIMQILSKECHQDKRPTNALIAKAVELCAERGVSHLLYCKYVYHKNYQDALTEFKRRNKFEQVNVPRYFVPLTWKGRVALALKLQLGPGEILPQAMVVALLKLRNRYYQWKRTREEGAPSAAAGLKAPDLA